MTKQNQLEIELPRLTPSGKIQDALSIIESYQTNELAPAYQERILSLSNKIAKAQLKRGTVINSPDKSRSALRELLQSKKEEVMCVLFLDTKHRVISFEELFH